MIRRTCPRQLLLLLALLLAQPLLTAAAHPLRLSLCEVEYSSEQELLTISLRLFVMDVNEALVFDPNSTALALGEPNEAPKAEGLLLAYLEGLFRIDANGEQVDLQIKSKRLKGEGDNTALVLLIEHRLPPPLRSLGIRNAVFTDLFSDQNNIIYVHVDDASDMLMLTKKTPEHELTF